MFLKNWKALTVLGLMAVLVAGGVGVYAMSAEPTNPVENDVPMVEVTESETMDTLTVRVGARVEGKIVPMANVQLGVFSVEIVRDNKTITITLEKVMEGETDQDGVASFEIEHGRYLVAAHYSGLIGFGHCNLEEDSQIGMLLHNQLRSQNAWRTCLGNAYQHMESMTIQIQLEDL